MSLIKSIRNFIKECPHLDEFYKSIGVDYLNDEVTSYMIEPVPAEPVLKRYINGDCKKQYLFVFASKEAYGPDVRENINNIGFYEDFAEWLDGCTENGDLPDLGGEKEALSISAQTTGYLFDASVDKAQYRIQCRLIYFERKGE